MLLLAFPGLKVNPGLVTAELSKAQAEPAILALWQELVRQPIQPIDDNEDF